MNLRERIRDWSPPIYSLGQNPVTLTGAVVTTSTALTTVAFWFYDIFLPGPPHPCIGILVFLILSGIFVLGLLLIPLGWVQQPAEEVAAIYVRNIFPDMRITWGTHPNNLGHNDSPSCFRCHDGSHTSADGQTITNDCSACHDVLPAGEENPKILTDLGMK
jgi:hypothetical protein